MSLGLSREDAASTVSRVNVVAVVAFLVPVLAGAAVASALGNPLPGLVGLALGYVVRTVSQGRPPVGTRRAPSAGPVRRAAGARTLLDRALRRQPARHGSTSASSRPASPPNRPDGRHRSRERRRGVVLDGARPREGGARGAELRAGGRAGQHRPRCATSSAARRSPICSEDASSIEDELQQLDRCAHRIPGASPCSRSRCATS